MLRSRLQGLRFTRRHVRYLLPMAVLFVLLGGGGLAALETDAVDSFGQGVWWALSLVTTVGFVGGEPITTGGRIVAAALEVFGFALLALTTAAVASFFVHEDEAPAQASEFRRESEILHELRLLGHRIEALESAVGAAGEPAAGPASPAAGGPHIAGAAGTEAN